MHSRAKHILNSLSTKWFLNVQWNMKVININFDSIIGTHFSELIRTIISTHLIEPIDHLNNENNSSPNSNLLNTQAEYEHLTLGQKIKTLKQSQTSYEILKAELAKYEWLEKKLLHTSGHNRDRNRIDSPSHKRTQSHDPSKPLHHTQFPSQDPSMFDDPQLIATNTRNDITCAPAIDLELNVQIQIASGSLNPTKQQQSQVNIGSSVFINKVKYQVSQIFLTGC
ncbi:unnamed protein product [Adineta steineri]|uniref:Uncharacterized protein n=1 Tax=Adineta steineri TaxID=433720 RepID=A0A815QKQ7_9BILA|nr:unnamed protein product [Adineta steineri]CAF1634074.1 unnamed protein product [Adineta steineri]